MSLSCTSAALSAKTIVLERRDGIKVVGNYDRATSVSELWRLHGISQYEFRELQGRARCLFRKILNKHTLHAKIYSVIRLCVYPVIYYDRVFEFDLFELLISLVF